jgi:hypothetical protein
MSLFELRGAMMGSRCSGPRLRVLVALMLVLSAQAVGLSHLISHTAAGDNSACAICVSAGHAGNAIPPSPFESELLALADRPVAVLITRQVRQSPPVVYRSRAPPALRLI